MMLWTVEKKINLNLFPPVIVFEHLKTLSNIFVDKKEIIWLSLLIKDLTESPVCCFSISGVITTWNVLQTWNTKIVVILHKK